METLELLINGKTAKVELFTQNTPQTIKALQAILPQKIELHYAKFVGQEVFGIIPLCIPLEKKINVNNLSRDSVVYYPERQLFCIYYGEIQEEDCDVTVIGKLEADDAFIREMEKNRYNQGITMLVKNGEECSKKDAFGYKDYKHLVDVENDWHTPPRELRNLANREGIMQPGGPIIYAEGETRKLGEILSVFKNCLQDGNGFSEELLKSILLQSVNRIGGWCGLKESAEVINQYCGLLMKKDTDRIAVLEDLILYINRLNMWVDLLIPWEMCNEAIRKYNEDNGGQKKC